MPRIISFHTNAFDEYSDWAFTDKKVFVKIVKLIMEIQRTPYEGSGKPEQLKHEKSGQWSRRINLEHRLIYEVTDDKIVIYSCKGHYKTN
jgi:toxin YoeB